MTVVVRRGRSGSAGSHVYVVGDVKSEIEVDPVAEGVGERGDEDGGGCSVGSGMYDSWLAKS